MLYRHVFDKISTEFRGMSRIYLNFAAPRPRKISEALNVKPRMRVITDLGWTVRFKPLSMEFYCAPRPLIGPWAGIRNNSATEMGFLAPTHPYLEASLLSSKTYKLYL